MGAYLETSDGLIHHVDFGGTGRNIVLVHGLGGSTTNWNAVGSRLADLGHVTALDLPGFGLTPPREDFTLETHQAAIETYLQMVGPPVTLVGNSMGGMLTMMVASARPDLVARLALISPATPPKLPDPRLDWGTVLRLTIQATPGLGEAYSRRILRRYQAEELLQKTLEIVAYKPGRIPLAVVEDSLAMARIRKSLPWAEVATTRTATSIATHFARRSRFYAMVRRIEAPTLVIQGIHDPIVSPTAVEWLCYLRPDWKLVQMEDTGHVPMLDAPLRTLALLRPWLAEAEQAATA